MELFQPITFIVCFIVGELLKLIFKEKLPKQWLPFITGGFGLLFCPLLCWQFTLQRFAEGLISGFASSGGYDAIKAIKEKYKDISK
ncbi:MAG: hypothetical protein ACI4NM_10830 [Bullifex sp.]